MFTAALIYILAVISPGPNFIIVSRLSALQSITSGLGATLGICTVGVIFSTLSLLGIATILHSYPSLTTAAAILGAIYLLYIAFNIARSVMKNEYSIARDKDDTFLSKRDFISSYKTGFLTNITNMKTVAFMISIYAGFLAFPRSSSDKFLIVIICSTLEILWYSLVAVLFSRPQVKKAFLTHAKKIDIGLAVFLVLFAINTASPAFYGIG